MHVPWLLAEGSPPPLAVACALWAWLMWDPVCDVHRDVSIVTPVRLTGLNRLRIDTNVESRRYREVSSQQTQTATRRESGDRTGVSDPCETQFPEYETVRAARRDIPYRSTRIRR